MPITKDDVIFPRYVNRDEIDEVLYSPDAIQCRVRELGIEISRYYDDYWDGIKGGTTATATERGGEDGGDGGTTSVISGGRCSERRPLIVMCTLRGAVSFFADLVRNLSVDAEWEFVTASSYGDAATSCGSVNANLDDVRIDVTDRDILIIEDILDTGRTLRHLMDALSKRQPNTIRTAVLLHKPDRTLDEMGLMPDHVGFVIPNKFVVGYGLDYAQRYRCLPWIGVLAKWVYDDGGEGH
jgi:hypoxanthine phosphoribosyltransferase